MGISLSISQALLGNSICNTSFLHSMQTTNQNTKASVRQKARFIDTTWEVITYDVWGNERDGFEVNQAFRHGSIDLRIPVTVCNEGTPQQFESAHPTDKQLREALSLSRIQIETEGDDLTVYVTHTRTSYPCGELRCTSHASLSPVRTIKDGLERELSQLEANCTVSDTPENAAQRTPEQLEKRYRDSTRMIAIRKELAEIFATENR